MPTESANQLCLRGSIYTLIDDPFLQAQEDCAVQYEDGLIIIRDGTIEAVGDYASLRGRLSADCELRHYPDALLLPGFIDATISSVISSGAGLPGINAVVMMMSTSLACSANKAISARMNSSLITLA